MLIYFKLENVCRKIVVLTSLLENMDSWKIKIYFLCLFSEGKSEQLS